MKNAKLYGFLIAVIVIIITSSCEKEVEILQEANEENLELQETIAVMGFEYTPVEGRYIVVFKDDKEIKTRAKNKSYEERQKEMMSTTQEFLREKHIEEEVSYVFSSTIKGFVAKLTKEELDQVIGDEKIKYVEKDYLVYAPPSNKGKNKDIPSTQVTPPGIDRVNGGITYTGSNVAWIIDTGIDIDHEDLNVDAKRGFSAFNSGKGSKNYNDGHGHGTHVAGTVAAKDNSVGVIGVAAGAKVVPVKVLDDNGAGFYSGIIAGVDHVAANGTAGDVANMSLGGPASEALDAAVLSASQKGIIFTIAAGNSNKDASTYSPARVNGDNIYTISAMDPRDIFAYFSNYGNPPVDYCAPGVIIQSTWKDGGYNIASGTSMAAPHAAGVFLLGSAKTSGYVISDPDGNPDPIIVH